MKTLAFSALIAFSAMASANDSTASSGAAKLQESAGLSDTGHHLDIYKVESVTTKQDPEKVDGLVKSVMVYMDRSGQTHRLEYETMGYGRQNG